MTMSIYDIAIMLDTAVATGDHFKAKPLFIIMGCAIGVAVITTIAGKAGKKKK